MPEIPSLTADQIKVAIALHAGKSETDAGRVVGVSRATVQRWKRIPEFKAHLESLSAARKEEMVEAIQSHLTGNQSEFLAMLKEYQRSQIEVSQLQMGFGIEILTRAKRIFNEMDDDKISASARDLTAVIAAGRDLIGDGGGEWAAVLGVDEVVKAVEERVA